MGYRSRSEPFNDGGALTPSNSIALTPTPRGLVVVAAGDVVLELLSGAVITYVAATVGTLIPFACVRFVRTTTTATIAAGY